MRYRPTDIVEDTLHTVGFDGFSCYESSGLGSVIVNFRDVTATGQIHYALPLAAGEGATIFFPKPTESKRIWVEVVGVGSVSGVLYSRVT